MNPRQIAERISTQTKLGKYIQPRNYATELFRFSFFPSCMDDWSLVLSQAVQVATLLSTSLIYCLEMSKEMPHSVDLCLFQNIS